MVNTEPKSPPCSVLEVIGSFKSIPTFQGPHEVQALRLKERFRETCPPIYVSSDPNHPGINSKSFLKVQKWVHGARGLMLVGKTGTGKTRAAWSLIKRLLCCDVVAVRAINDPSFSREYSTRLGNGSANDWMDRLTRCQVLFIDDFGKASVTSRYKEQIYDVLETRMSKGIPFIITTQWGKDKLKEKFGDDDGMAIIRRILESCEIIKF